MPLLRRRRVRPGQDDRGWSPQVALTRPGARGRLTITDDKGRVTGWDGTRRLNEIPGADVQEPLLIRRELVARP